MGSTGHSTQVSDPSFMQTSDGREAHTLGSTKKRSMSKWREFADAAARLAVEAREKTAKRSFMVGRFFWSNDETVFVEEIFTVWNGVRCLLASAFKRSNLRIVSKSNQLSQTNK